MNTTRTDVTIPDLADDGSAIIELGEYQLALAGGGVGEVVLS